MRRRAVRWCQPRVLYITLTVAWHIVRRLVAVAFFQISRILSSYRVFYFCFPCRRRSVTSILTVLVPIIVSRNNTAVLFVVEPYCVRWGRAQPPLSIRHPLIDGKVIKVTAERINANYTHSPVGLPVRSPVSLTEQDWRREEQAHRCIIGRAPRWQEAYWWSLMLTNKPIIEHGRIFRGTSKCQLQLVVILDCHPKNVEN